MQKTVAIVFLLLLGLPSFSQYLHTPEEISRIMDHSKLHYSIDSGYTQKVTTPLPIVESGWFTKETEEGIVLAKKTVSRAGEGARQYELAQRALEKKKYSKAVNYYKKALSYDDSDIEIIKKIGQVYENRNEPVTAGYWYERALAVNFVDFEAHWLLAKACYRQNDGEKALRHITLAHALNRNHPEILESLKAIYKEQGLDYADWRFDPCFAIQKAEGDKVKVQFHTPPWHAYANCKAVWTFEPGYRTKMGELSNEDENIIEEKECLLNALISYEEMQEGKEDFPELKSLSLALTNKMIDFYIIYEIHSRSRPLMISQMPKEEIEKLVSYITSIRVSNIP